APGSRTFVLGALIPIRPPDLFIRHQGPFDGSRGVSMRATTTPAKRRTRGIASAMVATALVALSILGSGTALAANPDWIVGHGTDSSPLVPQPLSGASSTSVSAGQEVGFFEWLKNNGTSNISQLYVTAT